ncbi:hypothetical protein ACRCPS_17660 [Pseudomonas aeruginosa]
MTELLEVHDAALSMYLDLSHGHANPAGRVGSADNRGFAFRVPGSDDYVAGLLKKGILHDQPGSDALWNRNSVF